MNFTQYFKQYDRKVTACKRNTPMYCISVIDKLNAIILGRNPMCFLIRMYFFERNYFVSYTSNHDTEHLQPTKRGKP